jgi:hypothetical protein
MAIISSSLSRLACLALAVLEISACAGEVACPQTQSGERLATVTLFDGPPSEHADLMPDSFRKTKDGGRSEWDVAYIFEADRKLFVECQYGGKVAPVVIEPKPSTTRCVFVTHDRGHKSLTCVSRAK